MLECKRCTARSCKVSNLLHRSNISNPILQFARGVQQGVAAGQPRRHSEADRGGGRGQPEGELEVIIGDKG